MLTKVAALGLTGLAAGCMSAKSPVERVGPRPPSLGMANPASVYCGQLGGKLTIVKGSAGDESGMCRLPDGTEIEEWTLFRRDHPPK